MSVMTDARHRMPVASPDGKLGFMAPTLIRCKSLLSPRFASMLCVLSVSGLLLMAADPAWKDKAPADWTAEDAQQILANSPWTKITTAGITRKQSEDERRAGGEMGEAHGVGFDGIDDKRQKPQVPKDVSDLVRPNPYKAPPTQYRKLRVRWESALPVRLAELKSGVLELPTLDDHGYSIAVYGIPGEFKGDPKSLGDPLKGQAALKRDGKKDVKPSSVEVFQHDGGVVVVYVFPLSAEITKKDGHVDFEAQIGRLVFTQTFNLDEMQFQGRLAL
jgi:hypothetical protein